MKKILVLSSEFPPQVGGIGTFAYNLSIGLAKTGNKVDVLTFGDGQDKNIEDKLEVCRISSYWNRKFLKLFPMVFWALWICISKKPEKILAMVWTHEGIVSFLVKKILSVKYILMTHGSEILRHRDINDRRSIMQKVFEEADSICANSQFTKELVASLGFKNPPVSVVHPPMFVGKIEGDSNSDEINQKFCLHDKQVLLTVARLVPRKGHALVIQALARLLPSYPNLIYVMTGSGSYEKELKYIASENKILDRVVFTGFVTDREVSLLYSRCDIYVSPSSEVDRDVEGFGIALAEASAHGKPVIAGQSGGVKDAVLDGETGLLIDKPDVEKLIDYIARLLDDKSLRDRLGRAGQKFVECELSPPAQVERFLKVLN